MMKYILKFKIIYIYIYYHEGISVCRCEQCSRIQVQCPVPTKTICFSCNVGLPQKLKL